MTPEEIRRAERLRDVMRDSINEVKRSRELAEWRNVWADELARRKK